jgi:hypothetical protein
MDLQPIDTAGKSKSLKISKDEQRLIPYINLKLATQGQPIFNNEADFELNEFARSLIFNLKEKNRLLANYSSPYDRRVQKFLKATIGSELGEGDIKLPQKVFMLDRPGLARLLSLPPDSNQYYSELVSSFRTQQGVLHNPVKDRRTTEGVFHVADCGAPIPADKRKVPMRTFSRLYYHALRPPQSLLQLPFTSTQEQNAQAAVFVSLFLRPLVCPAIAGISEEKRMEIRFYAPGSLVSNLDFVESIFGNAGDPTLPENDAALFPDNWTGQTGCVILAPHLIHLTKKELGLPHISEADDRAVRDKMCWQNEDEKYNDGSAFKITCRDERGVIVTLIADNYFGYCKKEVKTQISYSANLSGNYEEEHAGGAVAYPSYDLGEEFSVGTHTPMVAQYQFEDAMALLGDQVQKFPEGYAVDRTHSDICYIPEDSVIDLHSQSITWNRDGQNQRIHMHPENTYVLPSGYKVEMQRGQKGRRWRLVGTTAEGVSCHKPCTVSGGGKSEISKSLVDAVIQGPVFTSSVQNDFDELEKILSIKDFSYRFKPELKRKAKHRTALDSRRSLGSVIKLLTPSITEYTDEYNHWLESIPRHIKELVFVLKRFYKPEWGEDWRKYFSVDMINGEPGNELKYKNQKLVANYLRVGFSHDGSWRTFGLRKDFSPAQKIQTEDDITASIVAPTKGLKGLNPDYDNPSVKFIQNCEAKLFQRPDEAIHRGYDKQTELDMSQPGNFFSNYQPLELEKAREMVMDSIGFEQFTEPMQQAIKAIAQTPDIPVDEDGHIKPEDQVFFVSSDQPRLVDGKPSKNPRYLQTRPDLIDPKPSYLAEIGVRLYRRLKLDEPLYTPVNAVLPGRRNNPPEQGVRPLCVLNPIHYQELPELFMDFICSVTGKSPSTTGAGSEGALTKAPFNALPPIIDLNNALVSYILTGYKCFTTAAGYVGPHYRVDHDISLLAPEIWSRMKVSERQPEFLIQEGYLEKCEDFEHEGKKVLASRLGYRITEHFVNIFFGRVFNNPNSVFNDEMLRPETQDLSIFVDGMDNIVTAQQNVAALYFEDGSIEHACPPLRALLQIMAYGETDQLKVNDPQFRQMFTYDYLIDSEWYKDRLKAKQTRDIQLWNRNVSALENFASKKHYEEEIIRLNIREKLAAARQKLESFERDEYLAGLKGYLGSDPYLLKFRPLASAMDIE